MSDPVAPAVEGRETEVFSVEVHDYDMCSHLGFFSTRAAAEEYRDSYNEMVARDTGAEDACVVSYTLDRPRPVLRGAWYVVLRPDGTEHSAYTDNAFAPGEPPRWVMPGYDNAPREWGELRQGFGLTHAEALASALSLPSEGRP